MQGLIECLPGAWGVFSRVGLALAVVGAFPACSEMVTNTWSVTTVHEQLQELRTDVEGRGGRVGLIGEEGLDLAFDDGLGASVPPGALAEDIDDAVLVIMPLWDYGDPFDPTVALPVSDPLKIYRQDRAPVGPMMDIRVIRLSDGSPVDFKLPIQIMTPYFRTVDGQEEAHIAAARLGETNAYALAEQYLDRTRRLVRGLTGGSIELRELQSAALSPHVILRPLSTSDPRRVDGTYGVLSTAPKLPAVFDIEPAIAAPGEQIRIRGQNFARITPYGVGLNALQIEPDSWKTDEIVLTVPVSAALGEYVVTVRAGPYSALAETALLVSGTPVADQNAALDTFIDSGPAGTVASNSASFHFRCNQPACSFECRLNDGLWASCSSPHALGPLADATHTFEVRARTSSGLLDETPARRVWRIDTVPPTTTMHFQGPTALRDRDVTLSFQADEPASFQCSLNGGAWQICVSPWTLTGLENGIYWADVRAVDLAGNVENPPRQATWEINFRSFRQIAGGTHTCAIAEDGTLWCWPMLDPEALDTYVNAESASTLPKQVGNNTDWTHVAPAWSYACGIREGGSLWCWGILDIADMLYYVYGYHDVVPTVESDPVPTGAASGWVDVDSGPLQTCGIREDRSLWCWGLVDFAAAVSAARGLIQSEDSVDLPIVEVPTLRDPTANWLLVSVGGAHACGIRLDHSLWCWGVTDPDALIFYAAGMTSVPPAVEPNPVQVGTDTDWEKIGVGVDRSCAMKADQSLWCWGSGFSEASGTGAKSLSPVQVSDVTAWDHFSVGHGHTCGLDTDRRRWCWGWNDANQAAHGLQFVEHRPRPGPDSQNWLELAAGYAVTCGLDDHQGVWCWGHAGLLGSDQVAAPVHPHYYDIPTTFDARADWHHIAVSSGHACGLRSGGEAWCWGDNDYGQLGDGSPFYRPWPVRVLGNHRWQQLVATRGRSCGIRADGTIWCWGLLQPQGEAGGLSGAAYEPVQVAGGSWSEMAMSERVLCAVRNDRTLWCQGGHSHGVPGLWVPSDPTWLTELQQISSATDWESVVVQQGGVICGLRTGGQRWCVGGAQGNLPWGLAEPFLVDELQAIGGPTATWSSLSPGWGLHQDGRLEHWGVWFPERVPETLLTGPAEIEVDDGSYWLAADILCGVRDTGALWCWSVGLAGVVPLEDLVFSAEPYKWQRVGSDTDWIASISGGFIHCGLKDGGNLWCWGSNKDGQLGRGSEEGLGQEWSFFEPAPVSGGKSWSHVDISGGHVCGITIDSTLYCWGSNDRGQVGNADDSTWVVSAPTAVAGGGLWQDVSTFARSTCGIRDDGSLWCWGDLPDQSGSVTEPQPFGSRNDWKSVQGGSSAICAIDLLDQLWCWGAPWGEVEAPVDPESPLLIWLGARSFEFGDKSLCVVELDGQGYCAGDGRFGLMRDGRQGVYLSDPMLIDAQWIRLAPPGGDACGLHVERGWQCWGGRNLPGDHPDISDVAWTSMAWGSAHWCGLDPANALWCGGDNYYGQLGRGDETADGRREVVGGPAWQTIGLASSRSCAIGADGSLWCWGAMGRSTMTDGLDPIEVPVRVVFP